ncbi:MAG: MBL fold metallo-hydrolase [Spirochaetota bacterium]|nr:MBL fold metallo-hydrolase [Spirochaetota bacterium]
MSITLISHGGAGEVTGSKHLLKTGSATVMIDCGAFQGKRSEADRKNREWDFDVDEIDAAVLTHAHYDHSGLLPLLIKKGYRGNIFSTSATRDLAHIIMMDSAKIQARDGEYLRKQAKKEGGTFDWEPLYSEKDAVQTVNQFVSLSYERSILIAPNIEVCFYDAGHILGSSLAVFTIAEDGQSPVRVAFSGDLGRKNKPIIRDPALIPDPDYLVLESTYGDRLHDSTEGAMEKLADVINRTAERGGKIIVPAFAIERTQELVFFLHLLTDSGKIPRLPIFVDSPMATNATAIFKVHPECYDEETNRAFVEHHRNPFGFNELRYIESTAESKELNNLQGPAVIVSSSGMCEAGRIQHHLIHTISNPANTVLIAGYMAENTLGRYIREKRPEVRILGKWIPLRAEVAEIDTLSAHADYGEMWEYVSRLDLNRLKKIFLVHGEHESLSFFSEFLRKQGIREVEIVEKGRDYLLS